MNTQILVYELKNDESKHECLADIEQAGSEKEKQYAKTFKTVVYIIYFCAALYVVNDIAQRILK